MEFLRNTEGIHKECPGNTLGIPRYCPGAASCLRPGRLAARPPGLPASSADQEKRGILPRSKNSQVKSGGSFLARKDFWQLRKTIRRGCGLARPAAKSRDRIFIWAKNPTVGFLDPTPELCLRYTGLPSISHFPCCSGTHDLLEPSSAQSTAE